MTSIKAKQTQLCKCISVYIYCIHALNTRSKHKNKSGEHSGESLPIRYSALELAHICACVTGLQHSTLYLFGRFACTV